MTSVPNFQINIKMVKPSAESTWTLIVLRVCIYNILSNEMTKSGYILELKCRNVNFNHDKGHKTRASCKRQEKQTLGCERWYIVQIFVKMLGVWPTKITLDIMLKIFHHLKLFQLLLSSAKLLNHDFSCERA